MTVALSAVVFNHDPNSSATSALNIRRNATDVVVVPEWRRGISVEPEDSPAAYALRDTWLNTIRIKAEFTCSDAQLKSVGVRAVPPPLGPALLPLLQSLLGPLGAMAVLHNPAYAGWRDSLIELVSGHVLGAVQSRNVVFDSNGQSGLQTFDLVRPGLWVSGVGIYDVSWLWQYRRSTLEPWTDLTTTHHRVYVVLEAPKASWNQLPYRADNTQLPWTDVLDYACRWASGAYSPDVAATRITSAVYALGDPLGEQRIEYGCPVFGSPQYSVLFFNCTAFLERLRGGIGNGPYVNCTDCATIVSTFANCLGCTLWQSRMAPAIAPTFATNPILAIGSAIWQFPCGAALGFAYHEVAWKGTCTMDEEVFDACLLVNGASDPTRAPFIARLPADIRYGRTGSGEYRDRLVAPLARASCLPQPTTRQRRIVV
jgi:hypothetical protein